MAPAPAVGELIHDQKFAAELSTRLHPERTERALKGNGQPKGPLRSEPIHASAAADLAGVEISEHRSGPPISMRYIGSTTADVTVKMEIDELDERRAALTETSGQYFPIMATPSSPREEQGAFGQHSRSIIPPPAADGDYADLQLWLEVTGYHDMEYRTHRIQTFRERQRLEAEAARISSRLQELKQNDKQARGRLNSSQPLAASDGRVSSALPKSMHAGPRTEQYENMPPVSASATTNGVKRARSPEPMSSAKAPRWSMNTGVPFSPAADPVTDPRLLGSAKAHSPLGAGLERKISYPQARWKPADNNYRTVLMPPESASAPVVRLPPAQPRNLPANNHNQGPSTKPSFKH